MSRPYTPTPHEAGLIRDRFTRRRNDLHSCKECKALVEGRDALAHVDWHTEQKLDLRMLRLALEKGAPQWKSSSAC